MVVRLAPFHCTFDPLTKLVPVTVKVNAAPPAVALVGDSVVSVGAGLLMVNRSEPEAPPPGAGLTTATPGVPAVAMSVAGTAAYKRVALT